MAERKRGLETKCICIYDSSKWERGENLKKIMDEVGASPPWARRMVGIGQVPIPKFLLSTMLQYLLDLFFLFLGPMFEHLFRGPLELRFCVLVSVGKILHSTFQRFQLYIIWWCGHKDIPVKSRVVQHINLQRWFFVTLVHAISFNPKMILTNYLF